MNARMENENIHSTIGTPTPGEQARQAAEELQAGAEEIKARGSRAANRLTSALDTARTQVQEKTKASAQATDRAIRDYPYASLGIAFGAGVLLGVLMARK